MKKLISALLTAAFLLSPPAYAAGRGPNGANASADTTSTSADTLASAYDDAFEPFAFRYGGADAGKAESAQTSGEGTVEEEHIYHYASGEETFAEGFAAAFHTGLAPDGVTEDTGDHDEPERMFSLRASEISSVETERTFRADANGTFRSDASETEAFLYGAATSETAEAFLYGAATSETAEAFLYDADASEAEAFLYDADASEAEAFLYDADANETETASEAETASGDTFSVATETVTIQGRARVVANARKPSGLIDLDDEGGGSSGGDSGATDSGATDSGSTASSGSSSGSSSGGRKPGGLIDLDEGGGGDSGATDSGATDSGSTSSSGSGSRPKPGELIDLDEGGGDDSGATDSGSTSSSGSGSRPKPGELIDLDEGGGDDSGATDSGSTSSSGSGSRPRPGGLIDLDDDGSSDSGATDSGSTDSGVTDSGSTQSSVTPSTPTDPGDTITEIIIDIDIPTSVDMVINPYHLPVTFNNQKSTDEIISAPQLITSRSNVPLKVSARLSRYSPYFLGQRINGLINLDGLIGYGVKDPTSEVELVSYDDGVTGGKRVFVYVEFQPSDTKNIEDTTFIGHFVDTYYQVLASNTFKADVLTLDAGNKTATYGAFRIFGRAGRPERGGWTASDTINLVMALRFTPVVPDYYGQTTEE